MWIKTRDVRFDRLWLVACRRKLLKCNSVKSRRTIFFFCFCLRKKNYLAKVENEMETYPVKKEKNFDETLFLFVWTLKLQQFARNVFALQKREVSKESTNPRRWGKNMRWDLNMISLLVHLFWTVFRAKNEHGHAKVNHMWAWMHFHAFKLKGKWNTKLDNEISAFEIAMAMVSIFGR